MIDAKKSVEERARAIAARIRDIRLGGDLAAVEKAIAEKIVELVEDATDGMPKPVLAADAEKNLEPWEGKLWGIFHLEATELDPVALFPSEAEAGRELQRRQRLDSEHDDRLPVDDIAVLGGEAALLIWNSYEPDPRESVST